MNVATQRPLVAPPPDPRLVNLQPPVALEEKSRDSP
jgi:hypothetical protein